MGNETDVLRELWGDEFYIDAATGRHDELGQTPNRDEPLNDVCPLADDAELQLILGALELIIQREGCLQNRRAA